MANHPDDNAFYETRFTEIFAAKESGDLDAAARLTIQTVQESDTDMDGALRNLHAAAVRLRRQS